MFKNNCPNLNHGRANTKVRFCSMCGKVVNRDIRIKKCNEEKHATMRFKTNKFCVYCGKQLIKSVWE